MKALITVIDDDGIELYKNFIMKPTEDKILDSNINECGIRSVKFNFEIRQLVNPQINMNQSDNKDIKNYLNNFYGNINKLECVYADTDSIHCDVEKTKEFSNIPSKQKKGE